MIRTPIALLALPAALVFAGLSIVPSTAHAQSGSYQQSCRSISTGSGQLSAECKASDGRYRQSSIDASKCKGDIGNQNGPLACNGATAQGGAFANTGSANTRTDDRNRNDNRGLAGRNENNRNDNGRETGGRGDHRGNDQRGGAYGDHRGYGDHGPAQGYGRDRTVDQRLDFMGDRIRQHADNGSLNRYEARSAYGELSTIQKMNRSFRYRDGGALNGRHEAYLQDRLDKLRQRIRDDR